MKVLIVSDTHGRRGELEEIIELEKPFQFLIHCGDVEGDEEYIRQTAGCDCVFVKGNNDFFSDLSGSECFILEDRQALSQNSTHLTSLNELLLPDVSKRFHPVQQTDNNIR